MFFQINDSLEEIVILTVVIFFSNGKNLIVLKIYILQNENWKNWE